MAEQDQGRSGWKFGAAAATGIALLGAVGVAAMKKREDAAEEPDYRVVESDDDIEVRDYPVITTAETRDYGPRAKATAAGFRRLAAYIGAKNRDGSKIEMTVPVLVDRVAGGWRTRFVMPRRFDRDELPAPDTGVSIAETEPLRVAVLRYSGRAKDHRIERQRERLHDWIADKGYRAGIERQAYYNSPMIPPPLRRNELQIAIAKATD